jgi:hypothetical protein
MIRHVEVRERANDRWRRFHEDRCLTLIPKPLLTPADKTFAMGSCFAREIRFALERRNLVVGPDYAACAIDPLIAIVDELPDRIHLNYFNSYTIRQEFERIDGTWLQDTEDYWTVSGGRFGSQKSFQDPYKRLTFAKTPEALSDVLAKVNTQIECAARMASIFFFTFGMTEVFRIKKNGKIACQKPAYFGGGGENETELLESGYAENLENMEAIRTIIKLLNPAARIVVTVSPVPLERTFTGRDIVVANLEGKSILRAAVGEFAKRHDDVTYFPAYEMVTSIGEGAFYPGDLRHVKAPVVDLIMQSFCNAHLAGEPTEKSTIDRS